MIDLSFLRSYEDWMHCITKACYIPLTEAFVARRIAALDDPRDHGTQRFIQTWGEAHLAQVKSWFRQADAELRAGDSS